MNIRNIKCEDGLVNGAHGVVVSFNWPGGAQNQSEPDALPDLLVVKFHCACVGQIHRVPVPDGAELKLLPLSQLQHTPFLQQHQGKAHVFCVIAA